MSYLVLARKYRPKSFAELVGQAHVVQALANALRSGRLHHAYLFTGTRGVGKTTVSRILAKSLNCVGPDGTGGVTDTPCGVCDPCRDIDRGRFVDYTELDAASNRGVDEIQSLLEQAVYKPVQGRFKVFMIDEVHMLSGHAFNAMLKTLEEPPEYLKFVLATTDPQKVPVTVLSRCLQFNLAPMAPQTVREHLTEVLAREQVDAEPAALRLIARAARGSMRDALSLTDQAIAFGGGQLQEGPVRQMLGSVDRTHVLRLIEGLAAGDARGVIATVDTLRTHGFSAAATLEDMSLLLQRMAVWQLAPPSIGAAAAATKSDDADTDPEAGDAARLAAQMPADETQLLYSICLHGRAELGLAPDEYAGLTMVLLRLLAFKPGGPVAAINGHAAAAPEAKRTPVESATVVQPGAAAGPSTHGQRMADAAVRSTADLVVAHTTRHAHGDAGNGPSACVPEAAIPPAETPDVSAAGAVRLREADVSTAGRVSTTADADADAEAEAEADSGARASGDAVAHGERGGATTSPAIGVAPLRRAEDALASSPAAVPRTGADTGDEAELDAEPTPSMAAPRSSAAAAIDATIDHAHAFGQAEALSPVAQQAAGSDRMHRGRDEVAKDKPNIDHQPATNVAVDALDSDRVGTLRAAEHTDDATRVLAASHSIAGTEGDFQVATACALADGDDLGDFWHRAVQQLAASGTITALVRELALQSQLIARDDRHWTLRVASASLDQPVSRDRLTQALVADGHAVALLRVEIAAVSDSPARRIAAAAEQAQREAVARIEGDPFVQSMMRDYGARIVPGSVRAIGTAQRAG